MQGREAMRREGECNQRYMYHTSLKIDMYYKFWVWNTITTILPHFQDKTVEVFWNLKASVEGSASRDTAEVMGEVRESGCHFYRGRIQPCKVLGRGPKKCMGEGRRERMLLLVKPEFEFE